MNREFMMSRCTSKAMTAPGGRVQTAVVEVYPTAEAAFSLSPNRVTAPGQPVYFVNLSENATQFMGFRRRGHEHRRNSCARVQCGRIVRHLVDGEQ